MAHASSSSSGPDCRLLVRVAQGDLDAFITLYDATAPRVLGLAHRVLRNRAMAEEVTQEVMVELWRTAARYDPALGSITNWVLIIAHRRAIDRVRSEQANTRREETVAARSNVIDFDPVADTAVERVDAARLVHYVSTLTELQRQVIALTYDHGYSCTEISRLLDVKVPTIQSRIRGAHLALRRSLTENSDTSDKPAA